MFELRQIIYRLRQGDSDRQIAKDRLAGRGKIAQLRALGLERGWLDPTLPIPEDAQLAASLGAARKERASNVSSLKAHEDQIKAWKGLGYSAVVITRTLRDGHGFQGSYEAVKRFVRSLEGPATLPSVMLEFRPGEAAQVDFGAGPLIEDAFTGEKFKTWAFVMTLAWSRHMYVELVRDQKVETWLACHRRAFEFFGGVPEKVIIDNPKCAITRACIHEPAVQRSYHALAEGYGFKISPCPPADPQKKGRVEAGVKYVKMNFFPLRRFRTLGEANEQALKWALSEAGERVHGTTKRRPLELFETERAHLRPLPAQAPAPGVWAQVKVHGNCHVQFEKCYYSAPYRFANEELWLRADPEKIQVFSGSELVGVHPRLRRPGSKSTVNDHLPPNAVAYLMRDPSWCRKKAQDVGPSCLEVVERLFADKVLDNLRAAQGVMRLMDRFGKERLEGACRRALDFDSPFYGTVKSILYNGIDLQGVQMDFGFDGPHELPDIYRGGSQHCRDHRAIMAHNPKEEYRESHA